MNRPRAIPPPLQQVNVLPLPRVLVVQAESEDTSELQKVLERNAFEVVVGATVKEALTLLIHGNFAGLVCNLHLPTAGDGFTLVNAMRHLHPRSVTVIMSDYPALRESMASLIPQADEIVITPRPTRDIVQLLRVRLKHPRHHPEIVRQSVATILERHSIPIISDWLKRVEKNCLASSIRLSARDRAGHLHALLHDLVIRLRTPHLDEGKAKPSLPARAHGLVRRAQGYEACMLVEESRMLQVSIFNTLRNNLSAVDLALVLTDVMTIADEVDSQLAQTMKHFAEAGPDGVDNAPNGKPARPNTRKQNQSVPKKGLQRRSVHA